MLSAAATALYWRTWKSLCIFEGKKTSDSDRRYAVHASAKCPASMKEFSSRDFDLFLAYVRSLMGARTPGADKVGEDGERRRLVWKIRDDAKRANLDDAYVAKLAGDLNGLACWDLLDLAALTNLRNTIHQRARAKMKPARKMILDPDKKFQPADSNIPF
ncbi:hypothetical protein BH09VER1_BH09VER1_24900 [soil metagenome]